MRPSELQKYYQRNMTVALVCAVILVLLMSFFLNSLPIRENHIFSTSNRSSRYQSEQRVETASEEAIQGHSSSAVLARKLYPNHEGFLGFARLEPVEQIIKLNIQEPVCLMPGREFLPEIDDYGTSIYGEGNSDNWGNDFSLIGDYDNLYDFDPQINIKPKIVNRSITFIKRIEPLYPENVKRILERKINESSFIPIGAVSTEHKNDYTTAVLLLTYVDSNGVITSFPETVVGKRNQVYYNDHVVEYIYDAGGDPNGRYFAVNMLKALLASNILPAVENGKTVCGWLASKYTFSLTSQGTSVNYTLSLP